MKEFRAVIGGNLAPAAPSNACILTGASGSDLPATPTEADWIASATKIMETKYNLDDMVRRSLGQHIMRPTHQNPQHVVHPV